MNESPGANYLNQQKRRKEANAVCRTLTGIKENKEIVPKEKHKNIHYGPSALQAELSSEEFASELHRKLLELQVCY